MASTYFHGNSEIQGGADGLQTLIFMNPAYANYSDTQQTQPPPTNNFVFLNSNSTENILHIPHAPPSQTQHFVGIPLPSTTSAASRENPQQQDLSAFRGFFPSVHYNLYNPPIDIGAAREAPRSQQGLSLSLSSQQPRYGSFMTEREEPSQPLVTALSPPRAEDVKVSGESPSSVSGVSVGLNGLHNVLLSSKYLKAAQEILDEVVNAGGGAKTVADSSKGGANRKPKNIGGSPAAGAATENGLNGVEGSAKHVAELSTAERQEIQMKKAKLVNMLDEVEQRYKQYHNQIQIVISWFEQATRIGSAKTYTDLALQTISKQFRCLKDAILGQIRSASKSLGEEDSSGGKAEGSRLKYVDIQIRQQRALQQLGMIQQNAWRPQRGLPERAVSVLRAWLFEHFLHPYPKDSDKIILAKQTGLTRSQVSNWFINARVRLWKPMVEEMYVEEMKGRKQNETDEKTNKSEENEDSSSKSTAPEAKIPGIKNQSKSFILKQDNLIKQKTTSVISMSTNSTSPAGANSTGFNLIGFSEMDSITQGSPKKPRNAESFPSMSMNSKPTNTDNYQISMKFGDERQSRDGFSLMGAPANFIEGFGSYPIAELGRFGPQAEQFQAPYSGNGVSLTLGLPHCENLSMAGTHPNFLPNQNIQLRRGLEIGEANDFSGMTTPTSTHPTNVYEEINIQSRKRFAAQLLPDFVT